MSVKKNWQEIGDYVLKIHELGMKYIEGAEHFGINVRDIYKYNSRLKKSLRKRKELGGGDSVVESGEVGEESSGLVAERDQGAAKGEKAKGSILPEQLEEIILNYRRNIFGLSPFRLFRLKIPLTPDRQIKFLRCQIKFI
jgi:hypothetical protein